MRLRTVIATILILMACSQGVAQGLKMSSYVRRLASSYNAQRNKSQGLAPKAQPEAIVFVRTSDARVLQENDCRLLASWDDIYIVRVPVGRLSDLAALPQILRIEAGESCRLTNDTTAHITGVRASIHQQTQTKDVYHTYGLTGDGVVVGVMDVGFDLTHPTFLSADGSDLRVKALWDQLDGESDLPVGKDFTTEEDLRLKRWSADSHLTGHGTHTSGTAAGSGFQGDRVSVYAGMAPDADLCLVANMVGGNKSVVPQEKWPLYTTATDMLGFKYIFDYAESVGKPCVINFSEGSPDDFYESALYREVLDKLVGPGRILCAAAGNEAYMGSYIHKPVGTSGQGAFLRSTGASVLCVLRSTQPARLQVTFHPKDGSPVSHVCDYEKLREWPDSLLTDTVRLGGRSFMTAMAAYPSCFDPEEWGAEFLLTDLQGQTIVPTQDIAVSVRILDEKNDVEMFRAVGCFDRSSVDPQLADFTYDHNILFPGSAPSVVTVGSVAYVTGHINYLGKKVVSDEGRDGVHVSYSSVGPTIDGLMKPDVSAPGMNVVSAMNSAFLEHNPGAGDIQWDVEHFDFGGRTYAWNSNSGTSMASPVVAGIIALWLQECPTLTPDEVKDVFAHTCRHYDGSIIFPNYEYGYGMIDAVAGLEYIRSVYTGIENIEASRPAGRTVRTLQGGVVTDVQGMHGIFIVSDEAGVRKIVR